VVAVGKEKFSLVVFHYPLHLHVQLLDVAVELCVTFQDLGLVDLVPLLGEEESRQLVGVRRGRVRGTEGVVPGRGRHTAVL
jgi:hypothetical protein